MQLTFECQKHVCLLLPRPGAGGTSVKFFRVPRRVFKEEAKENRHSIQGPHPIQVGKKE